jgi:hypothetical protein
MFVTGVVYGQSHRGFTQRRVDQVANGYEVPESYKLAWGFETLRRVELRQIRKNLEAGLKEQTLLFPNEELKIPREIWDSAKEVSSTRFFFVMDEEGRVKYLLLGGGARFLGTVQAKSRWKRVGQFMLKKVAAPVVQGMALSVAYIPVSRLLNSESRVVSGSSGGGIPGGCHMDGAQIHCQ